MDVSQTVYLNSPKEGGGLPKITSVAVADPDLSLWFDPVTSIEQLPGDVGIRGVATLHARLLSRADAGVGAAGAAIAYEGPGFSGSHPISVMWSVKQIFSFEPSRLFVTVREDDGGAISKSVWLRSQEGRPFRIRSINTAAP